MRVKVVGWWLAVAAVCIGCGGDDDSDTDAGDAAAGDGALLAGDDCITDTGAAERHRFECDGITYNVSVPEDCTAGGCGLIFDVHGFSMSGDMQEANTELARRGREHGYLVVQPNANPAPPTSSWDGTTDDAKVADFMQRMIDVFVVDEDRVHFTGFSQGGYMTWRFLCEHSDKLASVAPAAATVGGGGGSNPASCISDGTAPQHVRPVLHIQGENDTLVGYTEGVATRDAIIEAQGMTEGPTLSEDDQHSHVRYENDDGAVYEWLEHKYGGALVGDGHCFPGSSDPSGAEGQIFPFKCSGDSAFVWGELVMQFFLDHPRAAD